MSLLLPFSPFLRLPELPEWQCSQQAQPEAGDLGQTDAAAARVQHSCDGRVPPPLSSWTG